MLSLFILVFVIFFVLFLYVFLIFILFYFKFSFTFLFLSFSSFFQSGGLRSYFRRQTNLDFQTSKYNFLTFLDELSNERAIREQVDAQLKALEGKNYHMYHIDLHNSKCDSVQSRVTHIHRGRYT